MFSEDQKAALNEPLSESQRATRKGGHGNVLPYLEGFEAINNANQIFGFDGWNYKVDTLETIDNGYMALVTLTVVGADNASLTVRQDVGFTHYGQSNKQREDGDAPTPDQLDMALKGAVTDALKRCLRTFGSQFGNNLYDKEDTGTTRPAPTQPQPAQNQPPERKLADSIEQEELTGRDADFQAFVKSNDVDWWYFVTEVLRAKTFGHYLQDGGTPKGAVEAFQRFVQDRIGENQPPRI